MLSAFSITQPHEEINTREPAYSLAYDFLVARTFPENRLSEALVCCSLSCYTGSAAVEMAGEPACRIETNNRILSYPTEEVL
jgi:hypothetical protein